MSADFIHRADVVKMAVGQQYRHRPALPHRFDDFACIIAGVHNEQLLGIGIHRKIAVFIHGTRFYDLNLRLQNNHFPIIRKSSGNPEEWSRGRHL